MQDLLNNELQAGLACPVDHTALRIDGDAIVCEHSHRFAIEQGIPVFAQNPRREAVPRNMEPCPVQPPENSIDPFVSDWLVNTNGNLYWQARGRLRRYPIPDWPAGSGEGKSLVDLGCSWGRWTIAAARAGFSPIGVDVHIDALAAGNRVSRQLDASADFICADAEHLPFQPGSIDFVFSYSVLQHLEKKKVGQIFKEVSRVLKPGGICLIQLPNVFGVYSILQQLKRGFREARVGTFEMRYWSRSEIRQTMKEAGMQSPVFRADGFFSQNAQVADLDLLSPAGRLIVSASAFGRRVAGVFPVLAHLADSLWIEARKNPDSQES
jgi:ubiquinone/menaquinone biosynthesis C-methylase UbiE